MLCSSLRSSSASLGLGRRAASTIAQKYSNALYSAALSKSPQTLTKVQSELNSIVTVINDVPDLKAFISNPTLSAKDRSAGLAVLYSRAESTTPKKEPVSDVTKNLFAVLSDNGRLGETQGVIQGFNELVAKYKGELEVVVTSAAPLPRDVSSRLESILKQSQAAQQSKSLKITNKVFQVVFAILSGLICLRSTLRFSVVLWSTSAIRALTSVSRRVSTSSTIFCSVCFTSFQHNLMSDSLHRISMILYLSQMSSTRMLEIIEIPVTLRYMSVTLSKDRK